MKTISKLVPATILLRLPPKVFLACRKLHLEGYMKTLKSNGGDYFYYYTWSLYPPLTLQPWIAFLKLLNNSSGRSRLSSIVQGFLAFRFTNICLFSPFNQSIISGDKMGHQHGKTSGGCFAITEPNIDLPTQKTGLYYYVTNSMDVMTDNISAQAPVRVWGCFLTTLLFEELAIRAWGPRYWCFDDTLSLFMLWGTVWCWFCWNRFLC